MSDMAIQDIDVVYPDIGQVKMGKSQVPRGVTKKNKCKCGLYYYPKLIHSSMNSTKACSICEPELYKDKKK